MFRNLKVLSIKVFIIAIAGFTFAFVYTNAMHESAAEPGASTVSSSEIPFQTARIVVTVGLAISMIVLLAIGLYVYSTLRKDQNAIVHLKYGSLLIDVYESTYEPPAPVIDVTSIDHLAKLADRYGTMILHIPRVFLQDYLVQTEQATYRYSLSMEAKAVQMAVEPGGIGVTCGTGKSQLEDPISRS